MRYSNEHKQQTRERLLASSGALAKRGGFASTGVAGLMKAIGLTGGAFYNHFPSKDDLFTEVVRQELSNSPLARLACQGANRERLGRCLQQYLSLAHLRNAEGGCRCRRWVWKSPGPTRRCVKWLSTGWLSCTRPGAQPWRMSSWPGC